MNKKCRHKRKTTSGPVLNWTKVIKISRNAKYAVKVIREKDVR